MKVLLFFLFIFCCSAGYSQNMDRVRSFLDTLTSPALHGRGAVNEGHRLAAEYIRDRFKEYGLKPIGDSWLQYFNYDINTFPGELSLEISGKKLDPGEEFIMLGSSGPGSGKGKLVRVDTALLSDDEKLANYLSGNFSGKVLLVPDGFMSKLFEMPREVARNALRAEAVIVIKEKLTAGLAAYQLPVPVFEVRADAMPETLRKASFKAEAELIENQETQNVAGYIPGEVYPDSFIVLTGHYDHLGRMGKEDYFPGANDNASGISMLLELADHYAQPENRQDVSVVFIAFGAEEAGLIGSKYFVENPLFPLDKIGFLLNMDLFGTGDEGIQVVNSTEFEDAFSLLKEINNEKELLPAIKPRGPAANSDHYFFYKQGVPSFFIYTLGGIKAYHDVYDRAETLPLTEFEDLFLLITDFVEKI